MTNSYGMAHPRTCGEFWERIEQVCASASCSVTSGTRTYKRNLAVGGNSNSRHRVDKPGWAADIVPDDGMSNKAAVARACGAANALGLHFFVESDHIHIQDAAPA